jgi:RNA polymerase sigma-70 factor (ECF subfamily)
MQLQLSYARAKAPMFEPLVEADHVRDLLVTFIPNLRRFATSLCRSRDLADDLVQMACERALANADRFASGTRFDAWMLCIVRNLWIDHLRKRNAAGWEDDIEQRCYIAGACGERDAEARLGLTDVIQAIEDLPRDHREVILLVCVEDFSYQEAAERLEVPIGTVMSRLARARKKLAQVTAIE